MAAHTCNKEADLAEIKTDIKYIRQGFEEWKTEQQKIKERVSSLEKWKSYTLGIAAAIAFVISTGIAVAKLFI